MNIEERHIDVGGLPTRYLRAGTMGPPLVLLHGVGDNALDWHWVMPTLGGTRRIYALDLPSSGITTGNKQLDLTIRAAHSPRGGTESLRSRATPEYLRKAISTAQRRRF